MYFSVEFKLLAGKRLIFSEPRQQKPVCPCPLIFKKGNGGGGISIFSNGRLMSITEKTITRVLFYSHIHLCFGRESGGIFLQYNFKRAEIISFSGN